MERNSHATNPADWVPGHPSEPEKIILRCRRAGISHAYLCDLLDEGFGPLISPSDFCKKLAGQLDLADGEVRAIHAILQEVEGEA